MFKVICEADLQECNIIKFFRNLESPPSWGSRKVETLCPLCHVPGATVAICTATVLQQSNQRNRST